MDAMLLSGLHAALPFVEFIPTLVVCLFIGTLVGYFTAKIEKGGVSLLLWLGLAILFTFMTLQVPLKLYPSLVNRLQPELTVSASFPELFGLNQYWFYGIFAIGLLCVLTGVLENVMIDQSLAAVTTSGMIFPYMVCVVMMLGAGFAGDYLFNRLFREPVAAIDTLLQDGATYYGQEVEKAEARKMRLNTVKPLGDLVLQPYELTLVRVDAWLGQMEVLVDFGDHVAACHVVYDQPTYCEILAILKNPGYPLEILVS